MPDIKHFNPDIVLDDAIQVFWRQGLPTTGIQALVSATGVSRSSLYATFGSKDGLYAAALDRYIAQHSTPAFAALSSSTAGLTSVEEFFAGLIEVRCAGPVAGWGCMVTNAYAARNAATPASAPCSKNTTPRWSRPCERPWPPPRSWASSSRTTISTRPPRCWPPSRTASICVPVRAPVPGRSPTR